MSLSGTNSNFRMLQLVCFKSIKSAHNIFLFSPSPHLVPLAAFTILKLSVSPMPVYTFLHTVIYIWFVHS